MSNNENLKNKTILITGASRGIGKAAAELLAHREVNLALVARTTEQLEELSDKLLKNEKNKAKVKHFTFDVSQEEDVANLKKSVLKEFSQVDILINNVGVGKYGELASLSVADYDWMMNSNMRSSFLITRHFSPEMLERQSGHVVFVGSVAGLKGLPGEAVYCASKFAQTGFAQALDYEFRKKNVKVTLIAPGGVKTTFGFGTGRTEGDPILDKMLDANDVAEAILFALNQSEKSRVFLVGMRPMSEPL